MIKSLTYSVSFPVNNVNLKGTFIPQPGITAVVGPNGSGKTLMAIELVRYSLFGLEALRGSADDYKKLEVVMEFVIRDETYRVERLPKKQQLLDSNGVVLAVGPDAVNKECVRLLGYGLKVFDICNASTQKNADLFGKMLPSKRKRLIDEVVGLTSNEAVEKACRTEAQQLRREIEAMSKVIRVPEAPVMPATYLPSHDWEEMRDALRVLFDAAQKQAQKIRPAYAPEKPFDPRPAPEEINALEAKEALFQQNEGLRRHLLNNVRHTTTTAEYTADQLDKAEARLRIQQVLAARGPRPRYNETYEQLQKMMETWTHISILQNEARTNVICPNCAYVFLTGSPPPKEPPLSKKEIDEQMIRRSKWIAGDLELPDGLDLSHPQIASARKDLEAYKLGVEASKALEELPFVENPIGELQYLRKLNGYWDIYDRLVLDMNAQLALNAEAEKELRALGDIPPESDIEKFTEEMYAARAYEQAQGVFLEQMLTYEQQQKDLAEKSDLAKAFADGATALGDARATIKSLLAPSLSSKASALIKEMTNGTLSSIFVDETMEITVDGQRIETLSGGGETVANIALRIALGQVLVAETFPVFLGDEMDADADDTRREAVAQALAGLKQHLKQIILVTHRSVEVADHVVTLGDQ